MADVQPENGGVLIATDLFLALMQFDLNGIDQLVINAVMYCTYGAGKKKAEISVEDIRYLLGASDKLRTDRLTKSIGKLLSKNVLFKQELSNGKFLLGIQKDYELWTSDDKMSDLTKVSNYKSKTYEVSADKMSQLVPAPEKLLKYSMDKGKFKHNLPSYKAELKQAKRLYMRVLAKTRSGDEAALAIIDFIDDNEWMRQNVKMQFTFMSQWFDKWYSQIPAKPKSIREDEELLGRRYRYDVKTKQWGPV